MTAAGELSGYTSLPEPDLLFAGDHKHKNPLLGLLKYGPYGLKFAAPASLRLAILAPKEDLKKLRGLIGELKRTAEPREAKNYYPAYEGFNVVFRIPIAQQDDRLAIEFPDRLEEHAKRQDKVALAKELFQCIAQLQLLRSNFDVALVYLPESWEACFEGESFNFRDYLKAFCAPSNIPIQVSARRGAPAAEPRLAQSSADGGSSRTSVHYRLSGH
jgi:hypothetical protein